jgi:hypothetical protein
MHLNIREVAVEPHDSAGPPQRLAAALRRDRFSPESVEQVERDEATISAKRAPSGHD